jgi:hypothetical protein
MWIRAVIVGIAGAALTALIGWSSWVPDKVAYHSIWLAAIGAIYLGFAFADGRVGIVVLELAGATVFLVLAFLGLWVAPALIGIGLCLHAVWDLAHRPHGIATAIPRWYPPFCAAFDFLFAGIFLFHAHEVAVRVPPR